MMHEIDSTPFQRKYIDANFYEKLEQLPLSRQVVLVSLSFNLLGRREESSLDFYGFGN